MRVFADRFLIEEGDVVDLATGECVRLSIERDPPRSLVRARTALCDALAALRHPLLLPIVDYGLAGRDWFEAHAHRPALRTTAARATLATRHLVRFLRASSVEPSSTDISRNVRTVIHAATGRWRPVGVTLRWRSALETVMTLLESPGQPGVTRLSLHGPCGSGLRTVRLQIARAARQAGFLVVDRRFGRLRTLSDLARHCCVLDWSPEDAGFPLVFADPTLVATRRHIWLRFLRHTPAAGVAIALGAFSAPELTAMIYADVEYGPRPDELRDAVRSAHGLPGALIETLTAASRAGTSAAWVHEAVAEYRIDRRASPYATSAPMVPAPRGVERVVRVIEAARALAKRGRHRRAERLLRKAVAAALRRGADDVAATARCDLGDLQYARGRPDAAFATFGQVGRGASDGGSAFRAMIGCARALMDLGRLVEAEAIARSVVTSNPPATVAIDARALLVRTALARQDAGAAASVLKEIPDDEPVAALLAARIARSRGDMAAAARLARTALDRAARGHSLDQTLICEAEIERMHAFTTSGALDPMRASAVAARNAAHAARRPILAIIARAEWHVCERALGGKGDRTGRFVALSKRVPPLPAAHLRAILLATQSEIQHIVGQPRRGGQPGVASSDATLTELEAILAMVHDATSEEAAVQSVAAHLLDRLGACSLVIRGHTRVVAHAGRLWPDEARLSQVVMDGGCGSVREGAAPDVAEPVRAGGTTIGCIAARWAPCRSACAGCRDLLRVAAAAIVPPLTWLNAPRRDSVSSSAPDDLLGPGMAADQVRMLIRRAAVAPYPVLIEGESGSGKELVARAIHHRSNRRARRFCAVNCAALTDELLEAELFGHARGAFTGAIAERPGLFEEADQGTLLLDEVADLSPRAQAKVLRALQEGEVRRVGETVPRRVDTRIVAATNRRLDGEVASGKFRDDLRFRLDVIRIVVPPLRERPDAVPWLAERFWAEAAARVGTRAVLSPELLAALGRYDWPGNVRELQNVLARLAVHAPPRGRVPASVLPSHVARMAGAAAVTFDEARLDFERRFVRAALARAGGRKAAAATQLGLSRQGLSKMLKRLGLDTSRA